MVDESLALGVLGRHGRGACEHWGLQPGDAEIVSASMGAPQAKIRPLVNIMHVTSFHLHSCNEHIYLSNSQS